MGKQTQIRCVLAVLLAVASQRAVADDVSEIATKAYGQSYLDNDFSYLSDPGYDGNCLGESLKQLKITPWATLDLGGEYRLRYHNENNLRVKPITGPNDDFFLSRVRLFANLKLGDNFRFFGEAIDASDAGNRFGPRATEVNRFDAQNLALDARLFSSADADEVWLRGGRQELLFGSQRLVSSRPWRNTPLNFDGGRLWYQNGETRLDAFWVRPIDVRQHLPEDHNFDRSDDSQDFFGLFGTFDSARFDTGELYYYGLVEQDPTATAFDGELGDFDLHTLGGRILSQGSEGYGIELEAGYQFGEYVGANHSAGFLVAGFGHKLVSHPMKPSLWVYYEWASGDGNLANNTHGTFQHLSPRGHYYLGYADITGRQNIQDLNLQFNAYLTDAVRLQVAMHNFWLAERTDALYNPGGAAIYHAPDGSADSEVGQELDLLLQLSITPRTFAMAGYSYFWAGEFFDSPIIQGGPAGLASNGANGNDASFFYTQLTVRW